MNNQQIVAVLQVCLWINEGLTKEEVEILSAGLYEEQIIQTGIKLCEYLNSIQLKGGINK